MEREATQLETRRHREPKVNLEKAVVETGVAGTMEEETLDG